LKGSSKVQCPMSNVQRPDDASYICFHEAAIS
jgi:hypothetical protein